MEKLLATFMKKFLQKTASAICHHPKSWFSRPFRLHFFNLGTINFPSEKRTITFPNGKVMGIATSVY